ncbi:MAG: GNAT family N-acetyltransferase, partial [Pseudomonadales bacterium]
MFKPQLITLQRGGLRIEPMVDADIPALISLAEANRQELIYMSGSLRLDWYRLGLLDQREGRALPFVIRLGDQL